MSSAALGSALISKGKVLVVDDDPVVLQVARERLEAAGYTVHVREQALGTAQWTAECQPDVILLDVLMPALRGGELAALLKRRGATSAAVVLHSSLDPDSLASELELCGAFGAIQKTSDDKRFTREFERLVIDYRNQQARMTLRASLVPAREP
jgi:CheY-like chemotaxis protein